jgi:hypothetical protein
MFAACIYTAIFLPIEIGVIRETKVNMIFVVSLVLPSSSQSTWA